MIEYVEYVLDFFVNCVVGVFDFILENKVIFDVFFVGIALSVIFLVLDFIFDIRDNYGEFDRFRSDSFSTYRMRQYKHKKDRQQERLNMEAVYNQRHDNKMKELHYYRESENIRHFNRMEEYNAWEYYKKHYSKNNHSKSKSKVNLDIEVEE